MSLLLDALKRAEQEKRGQAEEKGRGPHLVAGGKPALELQAMPAADAPPPRSASQGAAQALAPAPPRSRRRALWIAGSAIVVVIAAAVGYVWYSISQLTPRPIARTAPLPPVKPAVSQSAPATPEPSAVAPAPSATAGEPAPSKPAPAPARVAVAEVRPTAPPAPPAPAVLQPSRAAERARISVEVRDGYEALRRGDLPSARRSYAAALANDPANLDALLGMATIEARGGNREAASVHYRRALEVDPRNASALAGLAAVTEFSRPEAVEARLLRDIAEQPGSAALQFMLGNLYSTQGRWGQAQGAYFEAHRLDPEGADILHNLAVSLDHLGQGRMAAGFYRKALEASRAQPAAFDAAAVQRRLAELER